MIDIVKNAGLGALQGASAVTLNGVDMKMPFRIGFTERSLWLLPIEPIVSVSGRKIITRRKVSKQSNPEGAGSGKKLKGSIKECWSTDDYTIQIKGTLCDANTPDELPAHMISKLNDMCRQNRSLIVDCKLLDSLGIHNMLVQDIEFPPTKGISRQDYIIRGISDADFELLQ